MQTIAPTNPSTSGITHSQGSDARTAVDKETQTETTPSVSRDVGLDQPIDERTESKSVQTNGLSITYNFEIFVYLFNRTSITETWLSNKFPKTSHHMRNEHNITDNIEPIFSKLL